MKEEKIIKIDKRKRLERQRKRGKEKAMKEAEKFLHFDFSLLLLLDFNGFNEKCEMKKRTVQC